VLAVPGVVGAAVVAELLPERGDDPGIVARPEQPQNCFASSFRPFSSYQ
jgi:hypothetical protein